MSNGDPVGNKQKSLALALGGGGVKGLAHIALLKLLDRHNRKPNYIVGTSMGAIIGALYATGLTGQEIEDRIRAHIFSKNDRDPKTLFRRRKELFKWVKVFSIDRSRGGFVAASGLFEHLFDELIDIRFEDLKIPFTAVATDFHTGTEVAINQGKVLDAVQASMAVPGVFSPVTLDKHLLVDGGLVNNLPCNHLKGKADISIASDVISLHAHSDPRAIQVVSGAVNIMLRAATARQLEAFPPSYLFQPDTDGIDAFDFHKIASALERGEEEAMRFETHLISTH